MHTHSLTHTYTLNTQTFTHTNLASYFSLHTAHLPYLAHSPQTPHPTPNTLHTFPLNAFTPTTPKHHCHHLRAVIQRVLPGVQEEGYTQVGSRRLFQGLLDGYEVFEALAHLAAVNVQVTRVQEVPHLRRHAPKGGGEQLV